MPQPKKYRLGNQPEEYELCDKYLGWIPEGSQSWETFYRKNFPWNSSKQPDTITLVNPSGKERVTLNLHQCLIKDAFPLDFFVEERAAGWWDFLIVSEKEGSGTKFVIPTH